MGLAALFALPGCTTGRSGPAPTPGNAGSTGDTASGTTGSANTLRIVLPVEPTTPDPATVSDVLTEEVLLHTFEGLTRFNAQNRIEPCLAQKWEISPDGKTYTFHLRTDVTFHNGRPFEAADVKYSWERALSPDTRSGVAAQYLDGILGVQEVVNHGRADLPGVVVVDPHTLKVTLDRPRAYFLGMLTMAPDFVVCKEVVAKTGGKVTSDSYVGTGPFRFESYQPGQKFVLAANSTYWDGKPKIDRIEMPILLDKETSYNNYITNKVDIYPTVPIARYSQDKEHHLLSGEYRVSPVASFGYLAMQEARQPAFAKPEVRRAIAYAIDRAEIRKVVFKEIAEVASGILPPGIPDAGPPPPAIPYDPAQARALLAKAGYPGGKGFPTLTLNYIQKNPDTEEEALIIRRNLHDNLGIEVNPEAREGGVYFADELKGSMAFYLAGWTADYLDPQDFLSTLFVSTASLNHLDYKNARFDALCAQADALSDDNKRAQLYGEAHRILLDDMAVVPLVFGPRITLIHANIQGWRENLCYKLPNTQTTKN